MDNFTLQGTAGETVHIRLTSTAFDPYVILKMPSGRQEDNDDMTPQTRDAGLDFTLSESGTHTVMVTSYRPGESGAYTLTMSRQGAGSPGAPITAPPGAGPGGRVFGIFAGISDYASQNDLPECANDARKLAEDLRRTGLMTQDHQVLLTDNQVTTMALRQAFANMSQQVGPQDVFLFFFSGHGGQHPSQGDANELDRQDETIVLYDAELLDNEMAQLYARMQGRINMIALDSCFSGGFAKDVITTERRMGLFSSEEDLTSAVAGQFQAGGYLSHFLRTGIDGEADASPRDGMLTAGELSHYLFRQFGAHVGDVGATDQNFARSFQHLVVDRGAVHVSDVLFAYR